MKKHPYRGGESVKLKKEGGICKRCEIIFDDDEFAEFEESGICKQCIREMQTGKVEHGFHRTIVRSPMADFSPIYEDGDGGGKQGRSWRNG